MFSLGCSIIQSGDCGEERPVGNDDRKNVIFEMYLLCSNTINAHDSIIGWQAASMPEEIPHVQYRGVSRAEDPAPSSLFICLCSFP